MTKLIKNVLLIVMGVIVLFLLFKKNNNTSQLDYQSDLIASQLKNVSKLIVSEGNYSEVLTFKDQKKYMMDFISFEKKAMMVINAKVTISYDLKQMDFEIDKENQQIIIKSIPKEEMHISPEIKFYDVEQSLFNPFTAEDYNRITAKVKNDLKRKLENSPQKKNAENRLISELSHLFSLTTDLGWTISYNGNTVSNEEDIILLRN